MRSSLRCAGFAAMLAAPALLAAAGADAQDSGGFELPVQQDFDPRKGDVRLTADRTAYRAGTTANLAVVLTIEPGWHTNSNRPSYEGLIGTEVRLVSEPGWTPARWDYPPGEMQTFSFTDVPISVYDGEVVILGSLPIPEDAPDGARPLRVTVTYQACNDRICLRPVDVEATFPLVIGDGGVPSGDAAFQEAGGGVSGRGWWWFLLLGFVGGLILNAMPCVLPVLSLKLFGLVESAGSGRSAVVKGSLATALGILMSFWGLAAAAIVARRAGVAVGWGIQFQEPLFVAALSVVVLLFTLNLWGLFEIQLPGLASRVARDAPTEGTAGHLATGFFATLMATPCSAPFLGTALGFALTRDAATTVAAFSAIGLGMASPYLIVAAFPGAARLVPRPGPWMRGFRVVMGFLLAATLVWLLYVLGALIPAERLAFFQLALLGVAGLVWVRAHDRVRARPAVTVALAAACVGAIAMAGQAAPTGGRSLGVAPEARLIQWQPFDPARAEREAAAGTPVFVDVTADWCFTCKVNERLFLETREVAEAFERHGVIAMQADWTRRDESISRYLNGFGRYGIPFYALYRPGREPHVFSELLSRRAVVELLED